MDLEFTRGDTQVIKFRLKNALGQLIELTNSDLLYFTVKQNARSTERVIQKKYSTDITYSEGYFSFAISSSDTASLNYGTYQYDIELKSGDYVKTVGSGTITLTEEITHGGDET